MLQPARRSVFHPLADSKPSRSLTRLSGRPLYERRSLVSSPPIPWKEIYSASTFASTSRLLVRSFTSTSRNSARHLRSGDHRKAAYVGTTGDGSPSKVDHFLPFQASGLRDALVTTVVGVGIIFFAGAAYLKWYKWKVLVKMENAFSSGYDPTLEIASYSSEVQHQGGKDEEESGLELLIGDSEPWTRSLRRKEQDIIDLIVRGEESGHYYVLLGAKGAGKTTMVLEAMAAIQAEGVSMCDAHPNLEVFRMKLGKALNYKFNEDTQTSLFQRRDPREAGPGLDIERALNTLEKVALRYSRKHSRPPVLVINNVHYFNNDDNGRAMLLQLQQRAEAWAASGIMTMVFSTDDFWPFLVMRRNASRMHVLSVYDLNSEEGIQASVDIRRRSNRRRETLETIREVVSIVGGRLSYLSRVSKARHMLEMANHLRDSEKGWLLSRISLIQNCDSDVADEQKWSLCSWLLLQEFVKRRKAQEDELKKKIKSGEAEGCALDDLPLPIIPYHECRQIMTRTDFIEELDRLNIINIDVDHNVRPDSFLILHAARGVVEEEGFEKKLESVRDRICEIESLHRTRELSFKNVEKGDRIRLTIDKVDVRLAERP